MLSLVGFGAGDSLADIAVFHDWNTGSIEAPPHSAGGGAWRSEAGQVLTDAGDQLVEAAGVLGISLNALIGGTGELKKQLDDELLTPPGGADDG